MAEKYSFLGATLGHFTLIAAASVGFLFSNVTSAAVVTFSSPGTISNSSTGAEIDNTETYVFAREVGGLTDETVNGVLFSGMDTGTNGVSITHSAPLTLGGRAAGNYGGTGPMFTLMDTEILSDGGGSFDVTLGGLTIGTGYRVQFLAGDRQLSNSQTEISSGGSSTGLFQTGQEPPNLARFVFANFTADNPTQVFTFTGGAELGTRAVLNGVSIFSVPAIPEPAGLSLLAMSGLFALRRRSR